MTTYQANLQTCNNALLNINDTCGIVHAIDLKPYAYIDSSNLVHASKMIPCLDTADWIGNATVIFVPSNKQYEFYFKTFSDTVDYFLREEIQINIHEGQILGKHYLSEGDYLNYFYPNIGSYSLSSDDGDLLESLWKMDDRFCNYIEVLTYDTVKKIATGIFSLNFTIHEQFINKYSQFISFQNGNFVAKIKN